MKVRKLVAFSAGTLMLVTNITPILADETYSMDTNTVMRICEDSIDGSSKLINDIIDGIEIEKEEPAAVNNEISSVQQPVIYSYVEQEIPVEQTMSVDEFMALYGSMVEEELQEVTVPVDTSAGQAAYDQALVDYNAALAAYEAANQMVETTKEVEVEIIEEVTDEQGNVTQVSHTEIQTVTEMAPAGDVVNAQVNLNAASAALESARISLEAAQAQTESFLTPVDNTLTDTVVEMKEETVAIEEDESLVLEELTYARSGSCGDNLTWTLDDEGLLTISGTGDMKNYSDYGPWGTQIIGVEIEKGVTSIGNYAFYQCNNLTGITIPEGVSSIGKSAFQWSGLKSITIPNSVSSIGNGAFRGCFGLTSITIPESVTSVGSYAFEDCTHLTSITIPESVSSIGDGVFSGCTGLKTAGPIGSGSNIEFGWKDRIPYNAFYYCDNLTSITIPESVTSIGGNAFRYCKALTSITIPESVTGISSYAFYGCSGLTSINIPEKVTFFGDDVFKGCTGLKTAGPIGSGCNIELGWKEKIPSEAFTNHTALTDITIPDSVTKIDTFAFSGCTGLTSITIPESVTDISASAFSGCTNLTEVTIPDTVTYIASTAFDGTPFIENKTEDYVVLGSVLYKYQGSGTEVKIPDNVKRIGEQVFAGCSSITSVTMPDSLISIGYTAFGGCSGLTSITIPDGVTSIGYRAFYGCTGLTSVTIPESVTSLGNYAFKDCTGLKTAGPIGSGCNYEFGWINEIPGYAFYGCENLTSITIPEGVSSIGSYAFSSCEGLTNITIPDSVKSIDYGAFSYCWGLTSITIPESVTSIGFSAFSYCASLTDVYYEGTEKEWKTKNLYDFGENVTIHFLGLPFEDVPEDAWYYSVAKECYETGLINGTSPTTFSPIQTMTRAMVVTILWRMDGQPKTDFNNKFKDVSSSQWYATSISWAVNYGVVYGYGDGTFKPDAAVTREQIAVMLANYAGYKKVYKPGTKKLNTYPDGSQVSTYAQAGMKWALTNGIISGDGAGYLRPKKSATRAEGAAMLLRMNNWL